MWSSSTPTAGPLPRRVSIPEDGDLPLRSPLRRAVSGSRLGFRIISLQELDDRNKNMEAQSRAWAGGEINKSLLTLGRVINAIFEHSGHIPWVVIQSARIKLKMVAANSTA
ncbi:hypothetical protein ACLB2K_033419 [Fragaria x ananassa]